MNSVLRRIGWGSVIVGLGLTGLVGCQAGEVRTAAGSEGKSAAPLFRNLGHHHRAIGTHSKQAQRYFDQGLTLAYAFNHDEAIRSFTEAARLDPTCAMAWWGIALCNGPHINNPMMDAAHSNAAWAALNKARELAATAQPVEQALIAALAARYAETPPENRRSLDEAYAAAMRGVYQAYPDDSDVGTLFAEALMDLRPWDLWSQSGEPRPETNEVLAALEGVLRRDPNNPGANHLYIHAVEASPRPHRANAAADRLRDLVPGAGHLVHIPSHIDVRTGRWMQAAVQNEKAIVADTAYRRVSPRQGFYHVYMAHNHHFLAYASMMEGRYAVAIKAAREMIAGVPPAFIETQGPLVDPYMAIVYDVQKRFGKWDDILKEPAPPAGLPITAAMWRFTRAIALAAQGEIAAAEKERAEFKTAVAKVPAGAMMAINPAQKVLAIADKMLDGEIAYRRGDSDAAITLLRDAVQVEDSLRYMEPPEWIQPVRHTLGAFLLDAGRAAEAERVYREDLARWPENGWSLQGLAASLKAQGKTTEAEVAERKFRRAWARADTPIGTTCLCVKAKE